MLSKIKCENLTKFQPNWVDESAEERVLPVSLQQVEQRAGFL